MTLSELSEYVYTLPYNMPCYINGVKVTSKQELKSMLKKWLQKDIDSHICQTVLPDGKWYIKLYKYNNYYDLFVPSTRGEEKRLINELLKSTR